MKLFQGFVRCRGLSNDSHGGLRGEDQCQSIAKDRMVFDSHDSDWFGRTHLADLDPGSGRRARSHENSLTERVVSSRKARLPAILSSTVVPSSCSVVS